MGVVLSSHSMSLDGFVVQADRTPGPLHAWLWSGDRQSRHSDSIKLSTESREWFDSAVDRVGATVAGRRTYEDSGRWGGELPFDWPFFIVTHRPPEDADAVPFTFVTEGVERAVELAKEAAGQKNVTVMGGDMTRQCLAAGLLDEIDIDLVPILLGEGVPLFGELADAPVELELQRIVDAPGVTHLSFRVVK
jgi:dihydrofolate reductase